MVGDNQEQLNLGWRIALTIILLLFLAVLGLLATRATVSAKALAQSSSDPLVLAFYYTWFDNNTWSYDQLSDLPAEPYVSRDRGVMGRHIDQAKAAGIDGFLVAWYGPSGDTNQTEPNLTALLEEAAARNFKIGILFETDSPFLGSPGAITGALHHAQNTHFNQPAYLRVDGRPVLFFWRPHIYGVDTWRSIRSQADPGYGSIWISEGVDMAYLAVFDGHHLYSNTWNPPSDLAYTNAKFARYVADARNQFGAYKFWVSTIMPGYNDVRIRPGSGFATDREGGAYYARSWEAAIASNPNWVVITSFNEWPGGTYIEPSAAYGDLFLRLTAQWSAQFKSGGGDIQAASFAAQAPAPLPTPTPYPVPAQPTVFVETPLLNLRAEPNTSSEIVGQASAGEAFLVLGQDPAVADWWQIDYAGAAAWVYAPLVLAAGPMEGVARVTQTATSGVPSTATDEEVTLATTETALARTQLTTGPAVSALPLYDPSRATLRPHLGRDP